MASAVVLVLLVFASSRASNLNFQNYQPIVGNRAVEAYLELLFGGHQERAVRSVEEDHPHKCCGKDPIVVTEKDQEMMKQCSTEISSGAEEGGEEDAGAHTVCWMQCMAQKKLAADSEGYMKQEEFTQQYLQHFTDPTLKNNTVEAIAHCLPICNGKAKELGREDGSGKNCNRAAWLTALCVRIRVETSCPEAEKIKTLENEGHEFDSFAVEHHRSTREVDYKFARGKCCGKQPLVITPEDRQVMDSCKVNSDRVQRDAALDKKMKGFSCWTECIARNKSVLNEEGYVVDDDFAKHYLPIYNDPSLHDLIEGAINVCIPAANNKARELGPEEINGKSCNRAVGLTLMCIRHKVESTCPAAEKVESVECTKIRQFLKEWHKRTDLNTE